jgi:hypothetical protein
MKIKFLFIAIAFLALSAYSCKSSNKTLTKPKSAKSGTSISPVNQKKEPLPKNYNLKGSRRSILGQEKK